MSQRIGLSLTEIQQILIIAEARAVPDKRLRLIINRSRGTISYHWRNLREKLLARTRTHAVVLAIKYGLIDINSL